MNFYFEEHGTGKPVILLHAFPLDRTMWRDQAAALAESDCRVILPDLQGFGTNKVHAETSTMEAYAREIASLLDYLKIEKACIGGLSMGGYTAFNLYRLFPEKFLALLLFDTSAAADTAEKRLTRFELIDKIEREGISALVSEMLPNLVSDRTKKENPELIERLEKKFYEVAPQAAIAALRGLAERLDHTEMLARISVPTLLIYGAEDKVTNLETAALLDSKIPDSKLFTIPKAGHYSNLENPAAFNEILVQFIRQLQF